MSLLVVMGMHRSGTSLVASSLRACGWDVGPEADLMPPKGDNPHGFIEHVPAVNLSERVLRRMGGSWDAPPALPPGWQHDPSLDDLRELAADVVAALLAHGRGPHLLKDPRLSLTLPFWQTVTSIDDAVLVLRPPDPVVRSLRRRHPDTSIGRAAALYVRYLLASLRGDVRLHVVDPGTLMERPEQTLADLVRDLGADVDEASLAAAAQEREERLWGRSSGDAEALDAVPELDLARACHDLVADEGGVAWRGRLGRLEPVESLASLAAHQGEAIASARDQIARLTEDLGRIRGQRDERSAHARTLSERLSETRDHLGRLRHERDELRRLLTLRGAALESALEEAQVLRGRLADADHTTPGSATTP